MKTTIANLALALAAFLPASLAAQVVAYHDASSAAHQQNANALAPQGYRMISLTVYGSTNALQYGAVWIKRNGPAYVAFHDRTATQYQSLVNTYTPQGYTAKLLTATGSGSGERFAGVLEKTNTTAYIRHGLSQQGFFDEVNAARGNGWRINTADVYGTSGSPRFIVSFEKHSGLEQGYIVSGNGNSDQEHFNAFDDGHNRPQLVAFNDAGRYLSTWRHEDVGSWRAHHGMTSADYQNKFDTYKQQGLYPISLQASGSGSGRRFAAVWAQSDLPLKRSFSASGQQVNELFPFDVWVQNWMQQNDARAAAMAIVKDRKLVYARGFNYAESGYPTTSPTSLFRIASLTKPITSIAVHQHYQKMPQSISANEKMVDYLNPASVADNRTNLVTVDDLLTHRGGWDRDASFDVMFRDEIIAQSRNLSLPISRRDIFDYMSEQVVMDFTPGGNTSKYSNYGFSLLGQILEELNPNQSYEQIIFRDIFTPLGITRPRVQGSLVSDRRPGEVRYHPRSPWVGRSVMHNSQPWVAGQYGDANMRNMDSHGAWVMAAPDLAKVVGSFDLGKFNPILGETQTTAMLSPPTGFSTTLRGWFRRSVKDENGKSVWLYNHNGKLSGSASLMLRREDNITVIFFTNSDTSMSSSREGVELNDVINRVRSWPTHNLWSRVGLPPYPNSVPGSFKAYGKGCGPIGAAAPKHSGSGRPETGSKCSLDLASAPAGTSAALFIGLRPQTVDLKILGAPGCYLFNTADIMVPVGTGRSGTASVPLLLLRDSRLVGKHVWSQYLMIHRGANAANLTSSNGLDILIGGAF